MKSVALPSVLPDWISFHGVKRKMNRHDIDIAPTLRAKKRLSPIESGNGFTCQGLMLKVPARRDGMVTTRLRL